MSDSPPIRVAHVMPTLSRRGGGVATFLWEVVHHGRRQGIEPLVAGIEDELAGEDIQEHLDAGVPIYVGPVVGPRAVGYSPALRRYLTRDMPAVDLVHSHGLRMYPSYAARVAAVARGRPLVVSPHGQLDPWILAYGRARKRVLGALYEHKNLRTAALLHATAAQEARHFRQAGLKAPIAVVPIGLDVTEYLPPGSGAQAVEDRWPELRGKRRLLFLSTIYPKKNLPLLARAWAWLFKLFPQWHLVVGGLELSDGREVAQRIIRHGGAAGATTFVGAVPEGVKKQLLAGCDLYVLPTEGENFGIAIAEALASGLPVITTVYTPWGAIRKQGCGWWIEAGLEPLCAALSAAMDTPAAEREGMGQRGRALIQAKYAWPQVIGQLRASYEWVLGRCEKPAHVYTHAQDLPAD